MIQLRSISLSFGSRNLFDKISATLRTEHIGLVGRNGSGKSTLLKIIAGALKPDEGSISIERGKRIAYLPQELVLTSTKTIFDETFDVFSSFLELEHRKKDLEEKLPHNPPDIESLLEQYENVIEQLSNFDNIAMKLKTERILQGLGFLPEQFCEPVAHLSVGWKMRISLAKLLLQNADFYLFDEPTNHLDMVAQEWFADFLKNASFGFLIASHDRYYLDNICNSIFELERGKGTWYQGNFTAYLTQKEHQQELIRAAYVQQQKDIAQKERFVARFGASASRAAQAQSVKKKLENIERIEIEPPLPSISFSFPPAQQPGTVVLKVLDVNAQFGDHPIFNHVSCEIKRGEKAAVVAANGVGKTTFFNLVVGNIPLQQGSVTFGHNVTHTIFEQDQTKILDPHKTVLEEVTLHCPHVSESQIRSFLGSFLFSGDDVKKKIAVLSGGERNRVAMVKVFLQKANFLILDEPTNHLDLYAKEILLQALQQYRGTILFVSHDHNFLDKLATRILELTPTGIHSYAGSYESYLWHKKEQEQLKGTLVVSAAEQKRPSHRTDRPDNKEKAVDPCKTLEKNIAKLEHNIRSLDKQLETMEYSDKKYQTCLDQRNAIEQELKKLLTAWEDCMRGETGHGQQ